MLAPGEWGVTFTIFIPSEEGFGDRGMDKQFLCGKPKQHHKMYNYPRKGISLSIVERVNWRDKDQIKLYAILPSLSVC